jgi:hypothetical protein
VRCGNSVRVVICRDAGRYRLRAALRRNLSLDQLAPAQFSEHVARIAPGEAFDDQPTLAIAQRQRRAA